MTLDNMAHYELANLARSLQSRLADAERRVEEARKEADARSIIVEKILIDILAKQASVFIRLNVDPLVDALDPVKHTTLLKSVKESLEGLQDRFFCLLKEEVRRSLKNNFHLVGELKNIRDLENEYRQKQFEHFKIAKEWKPERIRK